MSERLQHILNSNIEQFCPLSSSSEWPALHISRMHSRRWPLPNLPITLFHLPWCLVCHRCTDVPVLYRWIWSVVARKTVAPSQVEASPGRSILRTRSCYTRSSRSFVEHLASTQGTFTADLTSRNFDRTGVITEDVGSENIDEAHN